MSGSDEWTHDRRVAAFRKVLEYLQLIAREGGDPLVRPCVEVVRKECEAQIADVGRLWAKRFGTVEAAKLDRMLSLALVAIDETLPDIVTAAEATDPEWDLAGELTERYARASWRDEDKGEECTWLVMKLCELRLGKPSDRRPGEISRMRYVAEHVQARGGVPLTPGSSPVTVRTSVRPLHRFFLRGDCEACKAGTVLIEETMPADAAELRLLGVTCDNPRCDASFSFVVTPTKGEGDARA